VLELLQEIFGEELSADAASRIEAWLEEHYQPKTAEGEPQAEPVIDAEIVAEIENSAYEKAKAEFEVELAKLEFDYALNVALIKVGVIDLDLIKVKLNKAELTLDEFGNIVGLEEQLDEVRERFPMLFTGAKSSVELFGMKPAAVNTEERPVSREELAAMNYRERLKLFRKDPALYQSLV